MILSGNHDPISNYETPNFSYPPSQPQTSSFDQFHCFGCGDPLEEGIRCQRCTCKWCGYGLREGFCLFCTSRDENSSIDVPNPNSFNDPLNIFTHSPQHQYESYSCELCGNDSYYVYDCPPWFSLVYEQELYYNQNIGDNFYSQNSSSFPRQYLCCDNCGGPRESFKYQPMNKSYFKPNPSYNSNYFGFDQPPQYTIDHQEDHNQKRMNDMDDTWNKMIESWNKIIQILSEIILQQSMWLILVIILPSLRDVSILFTMMTVIMRRVLFL
nr:hypothetical protein [Tanacetum cinerariifolium]